MVNQCYKIFVRKLGCILLTKYKSRRLFSKSPSGVTVPVFPSWRKIFDEDSQMFFEQGIMTLQTCVLVGSLSAFPTDVQFATFHHIGLHRIPLSLSFVL